MTIGQQKNWGKMVKGWWKYSKMTSDEHSKDGQRASEGWQKDNDRW